MNKYVAVVLDYDNVDLDVKMFDDYDDALKFINSSDFKAVIIKIENMCDQALIGPSVNIDWHT